MLKGFPGVPEVVRLPVGTSEYKPVSDLWIIRFCRNVILPALMLLRTRRSFSAAFLNIAWITRNFSATQGKKKASPEAGE